MGYYSDSWGVQKCQRCPWRQSHLSFFSTLSWMQEIRRKILRIYQKQKELSRAFFLSNQQWSQQSWRSQKLQYNSSLCFLQKSMHKSFYLSNAHFHIRTFRIVPSNHRRGETARFQKFLQRNWRKEAKREGNAGFVGLNEMMIVDQNVTSWSKLNLLMKP